jgi:tripartite-type tricarboxylate transporter receptor subunit TctC
MSRQRAGVFSAIGALVALVAFPCLAEYPEKPVRLVSPFVAGGLGDTSIRLVAERLSRSLGQPILIDARAGADGQLAAMEVRRAAPDGYTLLVGETTSLSMVPAVRKDPPYDALQDFTAIGHIASGTYILAIHPSVPARTLDQFVAHARKNPGALLYGSSNAPALLATLHFMRHARVQMVHVPYRGEPQAIPDLLVGRVQVTIATPFLTAQPVKEGKLRVLAAVSPQRSQLFPDVLTLRELGYPEPPQISWVGLFGPARLPASITGRLSKELSAALAPAALRNELEKRGAVARSSSPDELREIVRGQLDFWRAAVREGLIPRE